jgi:hypothetical protein
MKIPDNYSFNDTFKSEDFALAEKNNDFKRRLRICLEFSSNARACIESNIDFRDYTDSNSPFYRFENNVAPKMKKSFLMELLKSVHPDISHSDDPILNLPIDGSKESHHHASHTQRKRR